MKKIDLAKEMAGQNGSDAADAVDQAVNRLIRALRNGRPARLPGLGTINPGKSWTFRQDRNDA
jgi:nucleoid DNA-binding protein